MNKTSHTTKSGTQAASAQLALRNLSLSEQAILHAECIQQKALAATSKESGELKARRKPQFPCATGKPHKAHKASHKERGDAKRAHAPTQRITAQSALVRGVVIAMREGESAYAVATRQAMPACDKEAQAMQRQVRALAAHLSPMESATLAKLTLERMGARRALADALAAIAGESTLADKPQGYIALRAFPAQLSPREARIYCALQTKKRKACALANWNDKSVNTTHAASRFLIARATRALALRQERKAQCDAGKIAGQRARIQFLGSIAIRKVKSGERIGRGKRAC